MVFGTAVKQLVVCGHQRSGVIRLPSVGITQVWLPVFSTHTQTRRCKRIPMVIKASRVSPRKSLHTNTPSLICL